MRPFHTDPGPSTTPSTLASLAHALGALLTVLSLVVTGAGCIGSAGGAGQDDASLAGGGSGPFEPGIVARPDLGSGAGEGAGEGGAGGGGGGGTGDAPFAAFDDAGALVVVRSGDGAVLARRELGAGTPTDIVVDLRRGRIVVVLEQEEEETRIVEVPWADGVLGAFRQLGVITGRARIALVDAGIVVASDADGPRVRLVRDDGAPSPGKALTAPRTWWSDPTLAQVHGLEVPPGGEVQRFTLGVDPGRGVVIDERRPLGVTPGDARLVAVGASEEWLVLWNEAAGTLDAQRLASGDDGGLEGAPLRLAEGIGRLDGAIAWPAGRRSLAIATAEPPALLVVSLDGGEVTRLPLAAAPPSGSPYGRRDLLEVGGVLLVATRAGVVQVQAPGDAAAAGFDGETLRGPLGHLAD